MLKSDIALKIIIYAPYIVLSSIYNYIDKINLTTFINLKKSILNI